MLLNCQGIVALMAKKVEDENHEIHDIAGKLQALDLAAQDLMVTLVEEYQNNCMDYVDILTTSGTAITTDLTEFVLPEWCFKVRLIEDITNPGNPFEIPPAELRNKESYRGRYFPRVSACWLFSRGGDIFQKVSIRGSLAGVGTIRVWYIRRLAPLHYGTARANASTSKIVLAQDGAAGTNGRVLGRSGAYDGFGVEITNDSPAGLKDQLRMLSGHVGSTGSCDVHTPWTAAPTTTTTYALVPPIAQEYQELLVLLASIKLLQDSGSVNQISILAREAERLHGAFVASAAKRQAQGPKYIRFNSCREDGW